MENRTRPLLAALWMMGAMMSFTLMAVAGRELGGRHDTFEIMFYRSLLGILIVVGVGTVTGQLHRIRRTRLKHHLVRNIFHFSGQNLWFYAVTVIPLSQVFALEFTTPLWVALLSPLFLGERMTGIRLAAAGLGFVGILIVARPDAMALNSGIFAAAACAICFAATTIATKGLSRHEAVISILFWLTVMQAVFGLIMAGYDGAIRLPSAETLPLLAVVGCCGLFSHFCITNALSLAPATVVSPLEFLRLPLVAIVGLMLYDEPILATVFIGAALVLAANLINILSEQRRQGVTA
ncbi:DMT family transporter [Algicella marina]|uniref:EamA family transporter n=1 Tax=Algicella marina TaxID=2683284 RepID=A0A6P1SZI4_9RHOB|nr:DMT family transporter [Algicella marina]QHQ34945.1 EamA family transporter [Algicella marina]